MNPSPPRAESLAERGKLLCLTSEGVASSRTGTGQRPSLQVQRSGRSPFFGTHPASPAIESSHLAALGLTPRECDVMQWVSEGKRDREIAIILGLSSRTVEKHIGHIFEKLKVETRTAAASYCYYLATQHQKINTPIEDGG